MIGQIIDARYKILRQLGAGGMGAVFEAEHLGTGRRCALKLILPDKAARADVLTRFLREARTMGRVESEHVVQVSDTGQDAASGVAFMAMELLSGEDLCQFLERRGLIEPDLALRIAAQALEGLCAAHEAGVVHRDLKPANLFLARTKGGKRIVKILDFGIAKIVSKEDNPPEPSLTKTGGILGSPSYMSPEQAGGLRSIDHRTDMWSLGAVLYHLLSGLPPYADAETLREVIVRICNGPPPALSSLRPSVPQAVSDLIERAMAHDPGARFESAREMLDVVLRLLGGPPILPDEMIGDAASPDSAAPPEGVTETAEAGNSVVAAAKGATHAGLAHTVDRRRSRRMAFASVLAIIVAVVAVGALVLRSRSLPPQLGAPAESTSTPVRDKPSAPTANLTAPVRSEPAEVATMASSAKPVATVMASSSAAAEKRPAAPTRPTKVAPPDPFGGVAQ